jgi:hypothetical protein
LKRKEWLEKTKEITPKVILKLTRYQHLLFEFNKAEENYKEALSLFRNIH